MLNSLILTSSKWMVKSLSNSLNICCKTQDYLRFEMICPCTSSLFHTFQHQMEFPFLFTFELSHMLWEGAEQYLNFLELYERPLDHIPFHFPQNIASQFVNESLLLSLQRNKWSHKVSNWHLMKNAEIRWILSHRLFYLSHTQALMKKMLPFWVSE